MLKYSNADIVFQEIPDEVTLAVTLTNCPHRCPGCHSPHLWGDRGQQLDASALQTLLQRYASSATCCCLMGGDADVDAVVEAARYIRNHSGLKVAWYSGGDSMPPAAHLFHYVKLGPYVAQQGGLHSRTTNQRLYKNEAGRWQDITSRFWRTALGSEEMQDVQQVVDVRRRAALRQRKSLGVVAQ